MGRKKLVVAAGVDGCRAGWVAAAADSLGAVTFTVYPDIGALIAGVRDGGADAVIAIDVPIGLPETPSFRPCDLMAREYLKNPNDRSRARFTSVFPPPDRELAALPEFSDVQAVVAARKALDAQQKGISRQSHAIGAKIIEVDSYVRAHPESHEWLFEVHPEVCFRAMPGGSKGLLRKKSSAGRAERNTLLRAGLAEQGLTFPDPLPRVAGAARDDVLDALVGLWVAMRVRSGATRVFGGELDACGVPMRMVT